MERINTLIVEDDLNIARLNSFCVEQMFRFKEAGIASNTEEARNMINILKPDLVLLDNYLPDGLGIDLVKELGSKEEKPDIILITAARDVETIQAAMRNGVFDYVIKPIAYSRLQESLQRYLDFKLARGETTLTQNAIDNLFGHTSHSNTGKEYPKGIDPISLEKVRQALDNSETFSATQLSQLIGVSRTTARRYLEYSVSVGMATVAVSHGHVGRPERLYKKARR
ncbi:response regulator [Endozoicomonas gorgoniicola]|uniref:Transcriptional regulatory protein n=1 Tax=Endozoicomonas gorgoniicola TaxID=1234144 RepID=A0ABT3MZ80_9GAMM|nr:response regulator [Endozoicomonas gorgoniicola]MCW7554691.1 response regulator [Endozoicomonas gorgoniicola]